MLLHSILALPNHDDTFLARSSRAMVRRERQHRSGAERTQMLFEATSPFHLYVYRVLENLIGQDDGGSERGEHFLVVF